MKHITGTALRSAACVVLLATGLALLAGKDDIRKLHRMPTSFTARPGRRGGLVETIMTFAHPVDVAGGATLQPLDPLTRLPLAAWRTATTWSVAGAALRTLFEAPPAGALLRQRVPTGDGRWTVATTRK